MRNIHSDKKKISLFLLQLLPFLLRGPLLLLTAAAFLYPEPGFGVEGKTLVALVHHARKQKILV